MPKAFHNQTVPGQQEHDALLFFIYIAIATLAVVIAIAVYIYGLHPTQIIELLAVLGAVTIPLADAIRRSLKRKVMLERQWPKPRLMMKESVDRRYLAKASKMNATLLGYEHNRKPVYWSDAQRAMQTNMPGMSGAGKSTCILNIVEQDIRRGHPVIIFDGKGEKEFVLRILAFAAAAGRGGDVRIIDPSHPGLSAKYNPFYSPTGNLQQRVQAVFDSLGAAQSKDEFFAEHQRAFLDSVASVLSYTGKTLTFQSILAACQQPRMIDQVIDEVRETVRENPNLKQHEKDGFEFNATALKRIFEDDDWISKIQGLLNSMKPFVGASLAQITGPSVHPVTFEEVIEKRQILIVSMNVGTDSQSSRSLGRILMRDLQSTIGARYDDYTHNKKHSFVSVVLDEFGLYAYSGFSNIIHTARQANAGFLFSFQSIKQLSSTVGESFADDVATATNCKFLMRISESDTAENFIQASAAVRTDRLTYQMEKPGVLEGGRYEESGRASRIETLETRVKDYQVKMLPTGQMMALLSDPDMGVVVKHVHVRQPFEYYLPLEPIWIDAYVRAADANDALRIDFTEAPQDQKQTKRGERRKRRQ
jgi:hypothetical protein